MVEKCSSPSSAFWMWDNVAMGVIEVFIDLPCSHMILASGGAFGVTMLMVAVIPSLFATWWFWGR